MPFTPAHAAAAFPFRRTRLVWSALIVGTMAPDFEYFLRLTPEGRHGHSLPGVFFLTLPLALATLWLFHRFVKAPFVELMPDGLERRLAAKCGEFRFGGATRFTLIVASILVGVLTHLVWDSFTHPNGWGVLNLRALQHQVRLPLIAAAPLYKLLQHISTLIGLAVLFMWLVAWYRTADVNTVPPPRTESAWPTRKIVTWVVIAAITLVASLARTLATAGIPHNLRAVPHFLVPIVVMAVGLMWWQFVALGIWHSWRRRDAK
ncbi:MAG: DUF4184 family protein [Bryobacteraceae bacterium]